jgi:hypothetical protein
LPSEDIGCISSKDSHSDPAVRCSEIHTEKGWVVMRRHKRSGLRQLIVLWPRSVLTGLYPRLSHRLQPAEGSQQHCDSVLVISTICTISPAMQPRAARVVGPIVKSAVFDTSSVLTVAVAKPCAGARRRCQYNSPTQQTQFRQRRQRMTRAGASSPILLSVLSARFSQKDSGSAQRLFRLNCVVLEALCTCSNCSPWQQYRRDRCGVRRRLTSDEARAGLPRCSR